MGLYVPPPERALVVWSPEPAPPAGYIKANGAALDTAVYAWLFSKIGYTFGGSGATFNAPDLRGEFLRGLDDGRGVDVGRAMGSTQAWLVGQHAGHVTYGVQTNPGAGVVGSSSMGGDTAPTTGNENRPRNVAALYCIAYMP